MGESRRGRTGVGRNRRSRSRVSVIVVLATAMALVLTSCTGSFGDRFFREPNGDSSKASGAHSNLSDDPSGGPTIAQLRPALTSHTAKYYAQTIDWKTCDRHFECGTVSVPIDWQKVGTESIKIAVIRHLATGSSLGNLLVNPGGPGGSGVEFVDEGVDGVVDDRMVQDYNIVGFDPRGVGKSSPVTCFDDSGTDDYFYGVDPGAIGSAAWITAEKKKSVDLAAACEKNTGAVLNHMDSISVAEDMDVIRAAMGDSKLNYLGYSYGTYLGTLYAGLFPSRVGKFVLDGADDPWGDVSSDDSGSGDGGLGGGNDSSGAFSVSPDLDGTVEQAVGFEGDLDDFLKSCVAGKTAAVGHLKCPFSGGFSGARKRVEGLFASVSAHPLKGKDGRLLGGAALATAIDESLYDPTDWPDLTRMFIELGRGNPAGAFEFADEYNDRAPDGSYDDNADFAYLAIGCLEDGHDVDLKFDKREAVELRKVAPMLGIYSAYGDLVCSGWKSGPTPFPNPIHAQGSGPILVVGTTGDPATPYAEAKDLANQLDNGHLITFHGDGHTAYNRGNSCIDLTVDDYLVDGAVPDADPDCS